MTPAVTVCFICGVQFVTHTHTRLCLCVFCVSGTHAAQHEFHTDESRGGPLHRADIHSSYTGTGLGQGRSRKLRWHILVKSVTQALWGTMTVHSQGVLWCLCSRLQQRNVNKLCDDDVIQHSVLSVSWRSRSESSTHTHGEVKGHGMWQDTQWQGTLWFYGAVGLCDCPLCSVWQSELWPHCCKGLFLWTGSLVLRPYLYDWKGCIVRLQLFTNIQVFKNDNNNNNNNNQGLKLVSEFLLDCKCRWCWRAHLPTLIPTLILILLYLICKACFKCSTDQNIPLSVTLAIQMLILKWAWESLCGL